MERQEEAYYRGPTAHASTTAMGKELAKESGLASLIRQSEALSERAAMLTEKFGSRLEGVMCPDQEEKPLCGPVPERMVAPAIDVVRRNLARIEDSLGVLQRFLSRLDV